MCIYIYMLNIYVIGIINYISVAEYIYIYVDKISISIL